MGKNNLSQYKGPLEIKGATKGIQVAIDNSVRLLEDAKILYEAGRYPSSTALAILAIEEAGKKSILRGLILARNEDEIKEYWSQYRKHTRKNALWLLPDLVAKGARTLDELAPLLDENAEHPYILDQLKQVALYTDCLGEAHWSIPTEIIGEDLCRSILFCAEILCGSKEVSEEEITLWVNYLKPVWMTTTDKMKSALINWYREINNPGDSKIDFESFILGKDTPPGT